MPSFTVPDISCDGCVRAITGAVHRLDAGASVQVDLPGKRVVVQGSRPDAEVAEAVRAAGFTVQDMA